MVASPQQPSTVGGGGLLDGNAVGGVDQRQAMQAGPMHLLGVVLTSVMWQVFCAASLGVVHISYTAQHKGVDHDHDVTDRVCCAP